MLDFEGRLNQNPRYDPSVREVYTDFTRWYLRAVNRCDCARFMALSLASVKFRYADLPSWVVDLTIFEDVSYLHTAITTFAQILWLMNKSESHACSAELESGPEVENNHLILRGRFLDYVSIVGEANFDTASDIRGDAGDRAFGALNAWRETVLARHSPQDPYMLPRGYNAIAETWEVAWLRMLCMGFRLSGNNDYIELTQEDIAAILSTAPMDRSTFMVLGFTPTFHGRWSGDETLQAYTQMATTGRVNLYAQVLHVITTVMYRSRMFMTRSDYLGFGNVDIKEGDRIFLSAQCGRPTILRPVEGSLARLGRTTYRIVSHCYLEGFMEGPDKDAQFACEDVWIE